MSNKKRKIVKKRIRKSRVTVFVLLLFVSIFSLSYATKNILTSIYSAAITKENTNQDKNEISKKEEIEQQGIEQLTLENEEVKKKIKVMIDPGHGGDDTGNEGFSKTTLEKDISLKLGKKVASKLSQYPDIEVLLTRSEDVMISIEDRINMGNSQSVDIFVSIHQNAESGGNSASGTESYYYSKSVDGSDKLAKSIQDTVCLYLETRNRGVLATNQEILQNTTMPSATIETGFLTNKDEEKKLNTNTYQEKMAEGISQGILSYIDSIK